MENPDWIGSLQALLGPDRVIQDPEVLSGYGCDWWPVAIKQRQQGLTPHSPQAVVRPVSRDEVSRVLAWATEHGVPVTPWGAGSSVVGAPIPLHGGISLDMSGMGRVLVLDRTNLLVTVEAGVRGDRLEAELNALGFTLNHSPQSLDRSTVGGWVNTFASGQFSSRWGGIEALVVGLRVVLPDGEQIETRLAPRASLGPNLVHLFVGSEGTLGVVTDVSLKIFPLPEHRLLETVRFERVEAGLSAMRELMHQGLRPFLLRLYDPQEAGYALHQPEFKGCLMFLGFEGLTGVAQAEYSAGAEICRRAGGKLMGPAGASAWMARRFDFSTIEAVLSRPGGVAETIEVAHFWDGILDTYWALRQALEPLAREVLCHFSHAYPQGTSLYVILLDEATGAREAQDRLEQIWETAMRVSLAREAAIAHHHSVGLARLPYLRQDLGSSHQLLARVKAALDPGGVMNPGKLGLGNMLG